MAEQDDRMTIGVFARTAKVSTSALRFYDDCGLVRPRAVDPITGYRYYSPDQLDEVTLIRQTADSYVQLTAPGGQRRLSTIAEDFPAYRIVLDALPEWRTQVVVPRDLLLATIAAGPQARLDFVVHGDLTVTSSPGQGRPRAVPADITGAPVAISFRAATLYPALVASLGPDVMLQISQPHLPAVLRCADDGDITTVVMPVAASPQSET